MTDLYVEEWGTGERTAVLIHGVTSSSATWWQVGPELAARGYHVFAPDLRGHGRSPRGSYSPEVWAADVIDAVPAEPELAIGLSLGGLVLATAVERLKPSRAVYEDPAWWVDGDRATAMAGFRASKAQSLEQVGAGAPRWLDRSVMAKYDALQEWDPDTVEFVADFDGPVIARPVVPSLVLAADPSYLVTPPRIDALRELGYEVRVVADTGHVIHNDDLDGYFAALDGWV